MRTIEVPLPEAHEIRSWVLRAVGLLVLLYLAYVVREIWLPLGLAFLIAMVLDPVVDRLEKRGLNRTWATLLIFVGSLGVFGGGLALLFPEMVSQTAGLERSIHSYFHDSSHEGLVKSFERMNLPPYLAESAAQGVEGAKGDLSRSAGFLAGYLLRFGKNLIWIVIVPIVAFYALRDFHTILAKMLLLLSEKNRPRVEKGIAQATGVFAKYLHGQLIVSTLNGISTGLLLTLIHVPSALLLGLIAGVLYTVPYVGAMITIVLTALDAFVGGGVQMMGLAVGLSVLLHQVVFDQIIGPKVVGEHVGIHPIVSITALLIGNLLLGIPGMILAVPAAACIKIALVSMLPIATDGESKEVEDRVENRSNVEAVSEDIEQKHLDA